VLVEDEQGGVNRIGSLLFDHVYQALLPGQFVTYGGKYYEVQSIGTNETRSGVVLRRAADHIRDRRTYRQWRDFTLADIVDRETVGSRTDRAGVQMRRVHATITVESHGYFELRSKSDLNAAQRVLVEGIPIRLNRNKAMLEIRLPDVPAAVRKTITLLLNELFVTFFPHSHPYIIALTSDNDLEFGSLLSSVNGEFDEASIYIVEDSMIDLGLIVAVERNWDRFMEMITDYLTWNLSPVEIAPPEPTNKPPFELKFPEIPKPAKRQSWFRRFLARFKRKQSVAATEADSPIAEVAVEVDDVIEVRDEATVPPQASAVPPVEEFGEASAPENAERGPLNA
jgi:hypothetical protein